MRLYIRVVTWLSLAGGVVATVLLAAAVLVVCQMIVVRYVLNASTVWQTEFVIYALVAATFLGSAYVLIRKGHVGVDLLPNALGGSAGRAVQILAALLSMVFLAILAWSAWHYFYEAWSGGWTTETVWKLPLWIPLLPMPLGIALLLLQYVAEIFKLLLGEEGPSGAGAHGIDLMQGRAD